MRKNGPHTPHSLRIKTRKLTPFLNPYRHKWLWKTVYLVWNGQNGQRFWLADENIERFLHVLWQTAFEFFVVLVEFGFRFQIDVVVVVARVFRRVVLFVARFPAAGEQERRVGFDECRHLLKRTLQTTWITLIIHWRLMQLQLSNRPNYRHFRRVQHQSKSNENE